MHNYTISIYLHLCCILFLFCGCTEQNEQLQRKIIIDNADILTANNALAEQYANYNSQLLKDYNIDLRVITTNSSDDINHFANNAFTVFSDDPATTSGRAVLMVINSKQDQVRIEISKALEHIYTDLFIGFIERQHMVYFFRNNRLDEGIYATTEALYNRARDGAKGKQFEADMASQSGGAGAKSSADIGRKEQTTISKDDVVLPYNATPAQVLEAYIDSRRNHNNNPALSIFTMKTQEFFKQWTITPVQMENEVKAYEKCPQPETVIAPDRQHAVLLFAVEHRQCSPYLFAHEDGRWKLDFASMNKLIGFSNTNFWHLRLVWKENIGLPKKYLIINQQKYLSRETNRLLAPYLFALNDYFFDKYGYPYDI